MTYEVCIDIGGTFTDLYIRHGTGTADSFKAPTTSGDFTDGLFAVLQKAADAFDTTVRDLLAETERFVHGTTVSTNAIIEGETPKTALITTDGFQDVLWLRPEIQIDTYEWSPFPDPFIPRWLTYGVRERVTAEGQIETPLDEDQARDIIRRIKTEDVSAVAVSLLWSHANPTHEQKIGRLLDDIAPDLHYSLSHQVNPVIREHRRTSTTAIDAAVHDLVTAYLSRLSSELRSRGFDQSPLIITANGGVMGSDEVADRPVWTVDSGPTMLPVAARTVVDAELDRDNVIALDMGGTSLDMCVIRDGTIPRDTAAEIGDHYVLGIDKVGVHSIGSGGGSIAWVDEGDMLRIGPESAGADPGPVCYNQGNDQPTVTDAALVLGYLNPAYFLGGAMAIDRDAAETAITERIGDKLALDAEAAAFSIYGTTIQTMVNGIKDITIEQGIDPRNHVLSGGGGALGTFVVPVARELGVDEILIPAEAGVVSAIGGLSSEIRRDFVASEFTESSRFDTAAVNETLDELHAKANRFFERAGLSPTEGTVTVYVDARYPQQLTELQIELPALRIETGDVGRLVNRFHQIHEETYGYAMTDEPVEFLKWRIEASGPPKTRDIEPATLDTESMPGPEVTATRDAYFDGTTVAAAAYRSDELRRGNTIDGPAFVDDRNTTIVLPPESSARVTATGSYYIRP